MVNFKKILMAPASGGSETWALKISDAAMDFDVKASTLRVDSAGNFAIHADDNGDQVGYVGIVAPEGNLSLFVEFDDGPTNTLYITSSALDTSGNVYVGGRRGSNSFIIKYNSSGTKQWSNTYVGSNSGVTGMIVSSVSGSEKLYAMHGRFNANFRLMSHDTDGTTNWGTRYYTFGGGSSGYDIMISNANEVVGVGALAHNFGTGLVEYWGFNGVNNSTGASAFVDGMWQGSYPNTTGPIGTQFIAQDSTGRYYLSAPRTENSNDTTIIVTDASRNFDTCKYITNDTGLDLGGTVINSSDELIVCTGSGSSGFDIVALDNTLTVQWNHRLDYSGGSVTGMAMGIDNNDTDNEFLVLAISHSDDSIICYRLPADGTLANGTYGDITVTSPTISLSTRSGGDAESTRIDTGASQSPTSFTVNDTDETSNVTLGFTAI